MDKASKYTSKNTTVRKEKMDNSNVTNNDFWFSMKFFEEFWTQPVGKGILQNFLEQINMKK